MRIKVQAAGTYGFFHLFVIYLDLSAIFNNILLPEKPNRIYAEFCHIFSEIFSYSPFDLFPGSMHPLEKQGDYNIVTMARQLLDNTAKAQLMIAI